MSIIPPIKALWTPTWSEYLLNRKNSNMAIPIRNNICKTSAIKAGMISLYLPGFEPMNSGMHVDSEMSPNTMYEMEGDWLKRKGKMVI